MKLVPVLVTGGREYRDRNVLIAVLDARLAEIEAAGNEMLVVHGSARSGADVLAEQWAKRNEVPYFGVPAKWRKLGGNRAGPLRNRRMLTYAMDLFENLTVEAFPDPNSKGTWDMVQVARDRLGEEAVTVHGK